MVIEIKTTKIKTKLTDKVLEEIKYLNSEIYDEEWSGILFYKLTGSVENIENLEILLVDILPMDKGSSVSTSFEYDEDFLKYLDDNPELEDCKHGLIHSHNKMNSFFSSTDISELEDNTKFHNFYLSVVSNNKLELIGKLCFLGKPLLEDTKYSVKNEKGNIFNMIFKKKEEPKEEVLSFDCDIEIPKSNILSESFIEKAEEICKPKRVQSNNYKYSYGNWGDFENWGNNTYNKKNSQLIEKNKKQLKMPFFDNIENTDNNNIFENTQNFSKQDIETFMFSLLSKFFKNEKFSNIKDIENHIVLNIDKLCENNILSKLESHIIGYYKSIYNKIFKVDLQNKEDFEQFSKTLNLYIDTYLDEFCKQNLPDKFKDNISYFFATIEDVVSETDY